jgi:hypothetical protein
MNNIKIICTYKNRCFGQYQQTTCSSCSDNIKNNIIFIDEFVQQLFEYQESDGTNNIDRALTGYVRTKGAVI